jgi:hypothetical protein
VTDYWSDYDDHPRPRYSPDDKHWADDAWHKLRDCSPERCGRKPVTE